MLFAAGLPLFIALNGGNSFSHAQLFRHASEIIRLGVEDTGWASVDPWWEFGFPDPAPRSCFA
jgi:hypothetical protein